MTSDSPEVALSKKTWPSSSYDSIVDEEAPTPSGTPSAMTTNGSKHHDEHQPFRMSSIRATLSSVEYMYDAATIRAEFELYHSVLPKPDKLLQQQHSVDILRDIITKSTTEIPRFLKPKSEGGIEPHNALCCLLLDDFKRQQQKETSTVASLEVLLSSWLVRALSFGWLYRQLILPADFIRDQFHRVAHVIPAELVRPDVLRLEIRDSGLPIPNFFLDPEDGKQFPPHIALLVILQDGQQESRYLQNHLYRLAWFLFAFVALILRLVLEVIGGAGAIWGGSEVFHLREDNNKEFWRWISIAVGIFCFLRFVTLNAPQQEDEGDILGPAGPWSLRTAARLRAVCEHPFHYFARAQPPYKYTPRASNHKDQ